MPADVGGACSCCSCTAAATFCGWEKGKDVQGQQCQTQPMRLPSRPAAQLPQGLRCRTHRARGRWRRLLLLLLHRRRHLLRLGEGERRAGATVSDAAHAAVQPPSCPAATRLALQDSPCPRTLAALALAALAPPPPPSAVGRRGKTCRGNSVRRSPCGCPAAQLPSCHKACAAGLTVPADVGGACSCCSCTAAATFCGWEKGKDVQGQQCQTQPMRLSSRPAAQLPQGLRCRTHRARGRWRRLLLLLLHRRRHLLRLGEGERRAGATVSDAAHAAVQPPSCPAATRLALQDSPCPRTLAALALAALAPGVHPDPLDRLVQTLFKWNETVAATRAALRLRYALLPCYYTLMYQGGQRGSPVGNKESNFVGAVQGLWLRHLRGRRIPSTPCLFHAEQTHLVAPTHLQAPPRAGQWCVPCSWPSLRTVQPSACRATSVTPTPPGKCLQRSTPCSKCLKKVKLPLRSVSRCSLVVA